MVWNNYRLWEETTGGGFSPTAITVRARTKKEADREGRKLRDSGSFIMVLDWEEQKAELAQRRGGVK